MKTILAYQLYTLLLIQVHGVPSQKNKKVHGVNSHNKQRLTQIATPLEKIIWCRRVKN